jgi:putative tryptophan/tyrosine transport system substrate-binding protein
MMGPVIAMQFLVLLAFFATPAAAEAQPAGRAWRIGVLGVGIPPACQGDTPPPMVALLRGLTDLGYAEGRKLLVVARCPASVHDATPSARDLVAMNPDVIVTWSNELTDAVRRATSRIPIVFISVSAPEQRGIVASLARPGGNLSGLSNMTSELNEKRIELLKEAAPRAQRIGVLFRQRTDRSLGRGDKALPPMFLEARTPGEIPQAMAAASKAGVGALLVAPDPEFYIERHQIVHLAAQAGIPAIYESRDFVTVGGLMAYGADLVDLSRRAASYVDRILKGAKPEDLPVEQPTKFELVINLKTAKALGLTIPRSLLLRADQVIE